MFKWFNWTNRQLIYLCISGLVTLFAIANVLGLSEVTYPAEYELVAVSGRVDDIEGIWLGRRRYNVRLTIQGEKYTYFYWSPDARGVYEALQVGDRVRVLVDPDASANIWEIERQHQMLRSYEEIVAYRDAEENNTSIYDVLAMLLLVGLTLYFAVGYWAGRKSDQPPEDNPMKAA